MGIFGPLTHGQETFFLVVCGGLAYLIYKELDTRSQVAEVTLSSGPVGSAAIRHLTQFQQANAAVVRETSRDKRLGSYQILELAPGVAASTEL